MTAKARVGTYVRRFDVYGHETDTTPRTIIGALTVEYAVTPYFEDDTSDRKTWTRLTNETQKYLVTAHQRISIENPKSQDNPILSDDTKGFTDYPALLRASVTPRFTGGAEGRATLLDYSPKTVNAKVQTSASSGLNSSKEANSSRSNTAGSSTAETNEFSVSTTVSDGMTGPSASTTASFSHSETHTSDHSRTNTSGLSYSAGAEHSGSASMSIKDWGAYAYSEHGADSSTVGWLFGQEYPWDVFLCRQAVGTSGQNTQVKVPPEMAARLFDKATGFLYPPSQLASYGFVFSTQSKWLVEVDHPAELGALDVTFSHEYFLTRASHSHDDKGAIVSVTTSPYTLVPGADGEAQAFEVDLNMSLAALTPLNHAGAAAIIGMLPKYFSPLPKDGPFMVTSYGQNLIFTDSADGAATNQFAVMDQGVLAIAVDQAASSAPSGTLYFKVANLDMDYSLYVKGWITDDVPFRLVLTINGDERTITKEISAAEGEGGDDNLFRVALRNLEFGSVDFSDTLQLGLNKIDIAFQPQWSANQSRVAHLMLRGLSIENA